MILAIAAAYLLLGSLIVGYHRHTSTTETRYLTRPVDFLLVGITILVWPLGLTYTLGKTLALAGMKELQKATNHEEDED